MIIRKIEENTMQICLSKDDLLQNNINYHSLLSNSSESQNFFLNILNFIEKEFQFHTKNYDFCIETFFLSDSTILLTIIRKEKNTHKTLKLKPKRKYLDSNIYVFNCFDDFYEYYKTIYTNPLYSKSLYYFNNSFFYIKLKNKTLNINILDYAKKSFLPEDLIKNYGINIY